MSRLREGNTGGDIEFCWGLKGDLVERTMMYKKYQQGCLDQNQIALPHDKADTWHYN